MLLNLQTSALDTQGQSPHQPRHLPSSAQAAWALWSPVSTCLHTNQHSPCLGPSMEDRAGPLGVWMKPRMSQPNPGPGGVTIPPLAPAFLPPPSPNTLMLQNAHLCRQATVSGALLHSPSDWPPSLMPPHPARATPQLWTRVHFSLPL